MLQKIFGETTFYCPRPNYKLSNLDASISKQGISLSTRVLLNQRPAKVIVDATGRLWLTDFVTSKKLYTKIVESPKWFAALYKKRSLQFLKLKKGHNFLASTLLKETLNIKQLLNNLEELVELQTIFLSYVYLPLIDELLIQRFWDIIHGFLADEDINEYIFQILKAPSYFREAIGKKIVFDENKMLEIPPTEKPFLLKGKLELEENSISLDSTILSKFPRRAIKGEFEEIRDFSILRALGACPRIE